MEKLTTNRGKVKIATSDTYIIESAIWRMDTSRMSAKENKKGKVHVISADGELKLKMMKWLSWQSTRMPP